MKSCKPFIISYEIFHDGESHCYTRDFDEFCNLLTFMNLELGNNANIENLHIEKRIQLDSIFKL